MNRYEHLVVPVNSAHSVIKPQSAVDGYEFQLEKVVHDVVRVIGVHRVLNCEMNRYTAYFNRCKLVGLVILGHCLHSERTAGFQYLRHYLEYRVRHLRYTADVHAYRL